MRNQDDSVVIITAFPSRKEEKPTTDYELAKMCSEAYNPLEKIQPLENWKVIKQFHPESKSDLSCTLYEKFLSFNLSSEIGLQPLSSPLIQSIKKFEKPDHSYKYEFENIKFFKKPFFLNFSIQVEWVFVFRGTVFSDIYNIIRDIKLFLGYNQLNEILDKRHAIEDDKLSPLVALIEKSHGCFFKTKKILPIKKYSKILKTTLDSNKEFFREILFDESSQPTEQNLRKYVGKITYTGHSLGAHLALVAALREVEHDAPTEIRAVVFESPGFHVNLFKNEKQKNWATGSTNGIPNITSYCSAPNLINTCYFNFGEKIRLHIPTGIGSSIPYSNLFLAYLNKNLLDGLLQFFKLILVTKLLFCPTHKYFILGYLGIITGGNLAFKIAWTLNQHRIENLISCFDSTTGLPKITENFPFNGKLIKEWLPHSLYFMNQIGEVLFSSIPFSTLLIEYPLEEGFIAKPCYQDEEFKKNKSLVFSLENNLNSEINKNKILNEELEKSRNIISDLQREKISLNKITKHFSFLMLHVSDKVKYWEEILFFIPIIQNILEQYSEKENFRSKHTKAKSLYTENKNRFNAFHLFNDVKQKTSELIEKPPSDVYKTVQQTQYRTITTRCKKRCYTHQEPYQVNVNVRDDVATAQKDQEHRLSLFNLFQGIQKTCFDEFPHEILALSTWHDVLKFLFNDTELFIKTMEESYNEAQPIIISNNRELTISLDNSIPENQINAVRTRCLYFKAFLLSLEENRNNFDDLKCLDLKT